VPNKTFVPRTVPDVSHLLVVSSDTVFDTTKNIHTSAVFVQHNYLKIVLHKSYVFNLKLHFRCIKITRCLPKKSEL